MSVQARSDLNNNNFLLSGATLVKNNQTLLTDAGRVIDLAPYTVMAQVAATKKWVPLTSIAGTDGTAIAKGIYMGDAIAAATIAAGDVTGLSILVGGAAATFDSSMLVIENSLTLDTVVGAATVEAHRVEDDLNEIGLFAEGTVDIASYEN